MPDPMTDKQKLLELAERCEQAVGPDRELGLDVMRACGWTEVIAFGHSWLRPDGRPLNVSHVPDPTTSLDAAMTLVPEGAFWSITMRGVRRGGFHASCATVEGNALDWREGATAPLAFCAAALRAKRAAQ